MSTEEKTAVDKLLNPEATNAQQKASLKWFSEYLEEGYILNLRPSPVIIKGLETFTKRAGIDAALKTRATNLIKKYKR